MAVYTETINLDGNLADKAKEGADAVDSLGIALGNASAPIRGMDGRFGSDRYR